MNRILAAAALPVLIVAGLSACAVAPIVTEERDIADAHAIRLETAGDVVVSVGEPALTITAPQPLMGRLTNEVVDGVLVLGMTPGPSLPWTGLRYELTLPMLDGVEVTGSGDVRADFSGAEDVRVQIDGSGDVDGSSVDAGDVVAIIDGSGDIELVGSASTVEARIGGSGDIDLGALDAVDAVARIDGSGDIRVLASGTLDAEIDGSGTVRYSGGAQLVRSSVGGSGDIVRDDG